MLIADETLMITSLSPGSGMYLAKGEYWDGEENFFPYGWSGTISGAATLIFSYVGYEVVASATEEAVNSKRYETILITNCRRKGGWLIANAI